MKYILDFDDVIFNTQALKEKAEELDISVTERTPELVTQILKADPKFDFKQLVFPEARAFIEEYAKDCIILSSATSPGESEAELGYQTAKLRAAGMWELLPAESIRVVSHSKKAELAKIKRELDAAGETGVFVDDKEGYLREAAEVGIAPVWMDGKGAGVGRGHEGVPTMLKFPRVGNFKDFRDWLKAKELKTE